MSDTSTWTLTQITFDTETGQWRLKGERFRPPIDANEWIQVVAPTFAEAITDLETRIRQRDALYKRPLSDGQKDGVIRDIPVTIAATRAEVQPRENQ
jgi:hypothetical protein